MKPVNKGVLYPFEKKITDFLVPRLPQFMNTQFLTYATVACIGLLFYGFYLAKSVNTTFLIVAIAILLQWLFDILDGATGRFRNEDLVRWGFFMDHLMDFVFSQSIIIGLFIYIESTIFLLPLLFASMIVSALFIIAFLSYPIMGTLYLSAGRISVSEIKLGLILFFATLTYIGPSVLFQITFYYAGIIVSTSLLCILVYVMQKQFFEKDKNAKERRKFEKKRNV